MVEDSAAVLTVGIAMTAAAVPVIWKSSDLRGDLDKKWSERVDIARAGLTERAIALLRRLQVETDEVLGGVDDFDPDLIQAEPGPLASIAGNVQRTIRARDRLARRLRYLLSLGLVAPILAIAYVAGVVLCVVFYLELWTPKVLPETGFWLASTAVGTGLVLVLTKFYLEQKLVTAEIMSRPEEQKNKAKRKRGNRS